MYWSRTGSSVELLVWLILSSLWWIGGWLVSVHVFRLRPRERFFTGGAIGFLLFILLSNAFAYFLPLTMSYWSAALTILLYGLLSAYLSAVRPILPLRKALVPSQLLVFIIIFLLFALINRGLAIWDDFFNLPIVSTLAAGGFPPRFYLDPGRALDYHYGLHMFSASLVRIGGFYPWSAFDTGKTLSISLSLVLAWSWLRRYTNNRLALFFGVLIILFSAGSRWLLLFAPESMLEQVSASIQMLGSAQHSAPDLHSAMVMPWKIEGDGPIPFPFAFASDYLPLSMAFSGTGAMPQMTLFLLLLLAKRSWRPFVGINYGLVLASIALTGEHLFVMIWGGIALAILLGWFIRRTTLQARQLLGWAWILLPGAVLAPVMGGALTQVFQRGFERLSGQNVSISGVSVPEIALRWPPAFFSGHLGELSIRDPLQIMVALAEMGPALLLAPLGLWLTWRYTRTGKWVEAGLGIAALIGFLTPMIISFSRRDRDLSRLIGAALFIWLVMSLPIIWLAVRKGSQPLKIVVSAGITIALVGGLALLPSELIAVARPQPSSFVQSPDVLMSAHYWDQLEPGAQVLDLGYIHRGPTLFGRTSGQAHENLYVRTPSFNQIMEDPNPVTIANAGYGYIYLDKESWQALTSQQRNTFQQSCVKLLEEQRTALNDFRRLLDIRPCLDKQ